MVQQISVFLQNKSGKLATIVGALSAQGVDIRALSIADTPDFGILRILVSDLAVAKEVLSKQNCIISINEVTVVAVPDEPGGLSRILALMAQANVDIEYMYSLIDRSASEAYMVFRVSDGPKLSRLLEANGLNKVSSEKLGLQ